MPLSSRLGALLWPLCVAVGGCVDQPRSSNNPGHDAGVVWLDDAGGVVPFGRDSVGPGEPDGAAPADAAYPMTPPPPARADLLALTQGHTRIVATIYSATDPSGQASCRTASDPIAAAAGYWDLGGYGGCSSANEPFCRNGAQKVVFAMTNLPDGAVKVHSGCVLPGQLRGSAIVATIYSLVDGAGNNTCLAASDPIAAAAGYWDLGGYGRCDSSNVPQCQNGARKVVMAMSSQPDGSVKYHSVCVLDDQAQGTRFVATLHSTSKAGVGNTCATGRDAAAQAVGYWDLGSYGVCSAQGEPSCQNGARKVVTAMTSLADGTMKYHTACVLPQSPLPSNWVGTLHSVTETSGAARCLTARDSVAQAAGYWDPHEVGHCEESEPRCDLGAKRVILSMTRLPDGSVKYHNLCVLPQLLEDGTRSVLPFSDGRNLLVYAHQDDDLLWMQPLWPSASQLLLSAYPAIHGYDPVIAAPGPAYQARWQPLWGRTDEQTFTSTYLDPCVRAGIVTEQALRARLEPYVAAPHVARVITHNPWGEYGHAQHRLISKVVRELAVEYGKDVWALAVRAPSTPAGAYETPPELGLPTIYGTFDHGEVVRLRRMYQQIMITYAGQPHDLWTWHDGELDYPSGRRPFVMLVERGRDLVAGNAVVAQLEASVPVSGNCP